MRALLLLRRCLQLQTGQAVRTEVSGKTCQSFTHQATGDVVQVPLGMYPQNGGTKQGHAPPGSASLAFSAVQQTRVYITLCPPPQKAQEGDSCYCN